MRFFTNMLVSLACMAILAPAVLIATGVLPYRAFVVRTGSMEPAITRNSVVLVHQGVYEHGQPITFETANGPVTHRLVGQRLDGELITKGDANETPDPGYVLPEDVIGGVVAHLPVLGYAIVYLRNPFGLASVLLVTIVLWLIGSFAMRSKVTD